MKTWLHVHVAVKSYHKNLCVEVTAACSLEEKWICTNCSYYRSFFLCCIKMKLAWRNRCNAIHHLSPVVNMHFSYFGGRQKALCMALHFSSAVHFTGLYTDIESAGGSSNKDKTSVVWRGERDTRNTIKAMEYSTRTQVYEHVQMRAQWHDTDSASFRVFRVLVLRSVPWNRPNRGRMLSTYLGLY